MADISNHNILYMGINPMQMQIICNMMNLMNIQSKAAVYRSY